MLYTLIKKALKKPFHLFGLEVVQQGSLIPKSSSPPEAKDHPMEALYNEERLTLPQLACAFACPLDRCITAEGFGYGPEDWHPFIAALLEYQSNTNTSYRESILKSYYNTFQPETANDLILGNHLSSNELSALHPLAFVPPWEIGAPVERKTRAAEIIHRENKQSGYPDLESDDGVPGYGPVSTEKGRLEYRRLTDVFSSIHRTGYNRQSGWDGDISGFLLRRSGEYRFLVDHGYHRLAAVAALGHESIPVRIIRPVVTEPRDVDYWPQVESGIYTREEALAYFHYLFDFDSLEWAREHNLLKQSYLEER